VIIDGAQTAAGRPAGELLLLGFAILRSMFRYPIRLPRLRLSDAVLMALEIIARQTYFRFPALVERFSAPRSRPAGPPQQATLGELRDVLDRLGVRPGALAMVHTSVRGASLVDDKAGGRNLISPAGVAAGLLSLLLDLVGDTGTLVMPTHPAYQDGRRHLSGGEESDSLVRYDPLKTPCHVGLTNELFRRLPGAQRSMHPLQSVSARGPQASELLQNNLNDSRPLPHGVDSAYYRICQKRGLVVSIGVPLLEYFTLIHTAEDVRDSEWPIRDFFRERRFRVRSGPDEAEWVVRERRPLFARSYCEGQLHRDFLREGILHEGKAGSLRVDFARANEVFEYLMWRNKGNTYPYFLANLAKWGG